MDIEPGICNLTWFTLTGSLSVSKRASLRCRHFDRLSDRMIWTPGQAGNDEVISCATGRQHRAIHIFIAENKKAGPLWPCFEF